MIVFTDLDGTLLCRGSTISDMNKQAIHKLRRKRVQVVLATGRSLYSFRRSGIDSSLFDYIIFSSGYGIYNVGTDTIILEKSLDITQINSIRETLNSMGLNYMVMDSGNDNHRFAFFGDKTEPEMKRRLDIYRDCILDFNGLNDGASQFLVLFRYSMETIVKIRKKFSNYSVVFSRSPFKTDYCWLEIFSRGVHKGSAAVRICKLENADLSTCMSVGNDYNDYNMLTATGSAFVVEDGNNGLHDEFRTVSPAANDGFAEAVGIWLKENAALI